MASKLKIGCVLLLAGSTTNACIGAIGLEDGSGGDSVHYTGTGGAVGTGGHTGTGGYIGTDDQYQGTGGYIGADDQYQGTGGSSDPFGGAPNGEGGLGGDGAD